MENEMQLYHDTLCRPEIPADPSDTPPSPGGDGIDLNRAMWDVDYRRQALEILRRARRDDGKSPGSPDADGQNKNND